MSHHNDGSHYNDEEEYVDQYHFITYSDTIPTIFSGRVRLETIMETGDQ